MSYKDNRHRNLSIAKRYRPIGVKVRFKTKSKRLAPAHAKLFKDGTKEIYSPPPDTRDGLFYFLHECAHLILRHWHVKIPVWRQEYEAEQWAMATMRREGIPVSKAMTKDAKAYVRKLVTAHINKGKKAPPKKILRWCGYLKE